MAIAKLNKTVVAGERARATDYNLVSAKVDEVIDAVNNKAEKSHTHSISQVSGLSSALNDKADIDHEHSASDIVGLDAAIKAIGGIASYTKQFVTDGLKLTITCLNGNTFTVTIPFATFSEYFETYEPGILSKELTKHLVRSLFYAKSVNAQTDLPTFSNSKTGETYRIGNYLYIRLTDLTITRYWVWSFTTTNGTYSSSEVEGTNSIVNVDAVLTQRTDLMSGYASDPTTTGKGKYYEFGDKRYLAECDSNGNLVYKNSTEVSVYVVDEGTKTITTESDLRAENYSPFIVPNVRDQRAETPSWFRVAGTPITTNIGNGESSDSGSSDSGSGSSDSGSTDSGGSSSSDTSDWGTFKLMFRIEDDMQLTVTQGSKTRTLTQSDRASNYYASIYVDPDVNVNVTSNVAKTWIRDNITIATNSNSFTITATNMANRQSYGYISVWSN